MHRVPKAKIWRAIIHQRRKLLNNFCPSRFSQVCQDFRFLQKRKSVQKVCLDIPVTVRMVVTTRILGHTFCEDLRSDENENLDTLDKI